MSRFERWSVWATSALTALSGIGYFWTKYLMATDDPFSVVNSPLEPWFLRVHVVVSPLLVFAVGSITLRHVWKHFRNGIRWGRRSGITTALVTVPMVMTGYLIQVVTGAGWLRVIAITHIVASFVYVFGLLLHQTLISRRPRAQGSSAAAPRRRLPATQASAARTEAPHDRGA